MSPHETSGDVSARSQSQPSQPALRPALKTDDEESPRNGTPSASLKAVQIHEPEPMVEPDEDAAPHSPRRRFHASVGLARRLSGKFPGHSTSSLSSASRPSAHASPDLSTPALTDDVNGARSDSQEPAGHAGNGYASGATPTSPYHGPHRGQRYYTQKLLAQVADWLSHEKRKKETRGKPKRSPRRRKSKSPTNDAKAKEDCGLAAPDLGLDDTAPETGGRPRSDSMDSQSSEVSLDRLQRILDDSMASFGLTSVSDLSLNTPKLRRSSSKKRLVRSLHRTASSDTEYHDGDVVVPSCDAILDNTRTLAYTGGTNDDLTHKEQKKARQAWVSFKNEIVRLAHTLRLKGWRSVPLTAGDTITVQRLSGALTNAVYVVSPPEDIVRACEPGKKPPPKLLLRIYGPNVEALIDRENELSVLRRLARKKIGPRLLGTFTNGRFEQFFNSTTLTPASLRESETSRLIAKRMRELHDGIEVLPEERDEGAGVWKNWERWLDTVEARVRFLDAKVQDGTIEGMGYVCGLEWEKFRAMVEKYRSHLESMYQGQDEMRKRIVFAHNDTQYGNILRVRPDDEASPLLQPQNQHKQLVVIDFEYAGPNTVGYEFSNHFTEWTYNYHDAAAPYRCNTTAYPKLEEQRRFVKAYVEHGVKTGSIGTPRLGTSEDRSSTKISDFMLDARVPPGGWKEVERVNQEKLDAKVDGLLRETQAWRPACSTMWIAWGIVQAKIEGVPGEEQPVPPKEDSVDGEEAGSVDGESSVNGAAGEEGGEEFNYLAYARERAMFFWGDCVLMGLIKKEDLPEDVRKGLKLVDR